MEQKKEGQQRNRNTEQAKKWLEKAAAITAAVFIWEVCALFMHNKILLASPIDVAKVLSQLIIRGGFWRTIVFSLVRISTGFFAGVFLGCVFAVLSGRFSIVEVLLWPYLAVIKSTPVVSVIVLCLMWLSSRNVSILISFFMVFPVVYTNVLGGIKSLDVRMEEMADVYGLKGLDRLLYVRLPQIGGCLSAALQLGCGMAWKSGIAAEVIGIPADSIGRQIYNAKIYLETPELFAWTFVLIVVSVLFERAVIGMLHVFLRITERRLV